MPATVKSARTGGASGSPGERLTVPASAVLKDGDRNYVFVHLGGERFRRQRVEVGREVPGQTVEIVDGLKAGVPVAVGGTFALKTALRGLGEDGHAH